MSEATTLLRGAALATAGIAAASLLSERSAQAAAPNPASKVTLYFGAAPPAGSPNPVQIPNTASNLAPSGTTTPAVIQGLNYAFALETLEAEFYRQVVARLTTGGTDMFGNTINGLNVSGTDVDLIKEFGQVENDHRDFLATLLNGSPANNFYVKNGFMFDFGINSFDRPGIVGLTYIVELHGVMAYSGAAPSLINTPYLATAAAILGTEARHTSALAFARNGLAGSQVVETAPLPAFNGHPNENDARDDSLTPDQILWQGGDIKFPLGTIPPGGHLDPVSGANGFVYKP